jgi:uncharacterized protein
MMRIKQLLTVVGFAAAGLAVRGRAAGQSYVPEYGHGPHRMAVSPVIPIRAYPFSIKEVRLLDGPFKEAMTADARYLLEIEPDRLLSDFRAHAGLKPKAVGNPPAWPVIHWDIICRPALCIMPLPATSGTAIGWTIS